MLAFNPSGTLAYVTGYTFGDTVNVIQVSSNSVVNTINVGEPIDQGVAFNPSGTLAYVTGYNGDVIVIDVATNSVISNTIAVGSAPRSVAFNPSGTLAYVTNGGSPSYSVSVIPTLHVTAVQTLNSIQANTGQLQLKINPVSSTEIDFTFNGVTYAESTGSNTIYGTWDIYGFAQDNGTNLYYYGSNTVLLSNTLTIDPALSVAIHTSPVLPTSLNTGQSITFNALPSDGSGSYTTYNFIIYNSDTNIQVANDLTTTNGFVYTIPDGEAGNTLVANVFVTDSNLNTVNSVLTGALTVPLPAISESPNPFTLSNTVIDMGQYSFANTIISGAVPPYFGNWSWSNANVVGSTGTESWHNTNSLHTGVYSNSCPVYDGYIYCVGGYNSLDGSEVPTVQYAQLLGNGGTSTWQTTNALSTAIYDDSCDIYDGYIYCPGGDNSLVGGAISTVQYARIYGAAGVASWQTTTTLGTGVDFQSCASSGGYIYCAGGVTATGYVSANVQYAQLYGAAGTSTWQTATTNTMGTAIFSASCSAYNGYIICPGGADSSFNPISTVQYAQLYGAAGTSAWQTTNALGTAIGGSCSAYGGYIYCPGGGSGASIDPISTVQYAQLYGAAGTSAWKTTNTLGTAIDSQSCSAYDGYIYCPGGSTTSARAATDTNLVQYAGLINQDITGIAGLSSTNNAIPLKIGAVSSTRLDVTYAGNTFIVTPFGSNTIYGTWPFTAYVLDSSGTRTISSTNTLTINLIQTPGLITESNTAITSGQYSRLTSNPSGGTSPYTINWFDAASCSGTSIGSGSTLLVDPTSDTTYSFNSLDSASANTVECSASNTVTISSPTSTTTTTIGGTGGCPTSPCSIFSTTTTIQPLSVSVSPSSSSLYTGQDSDVVATASGGTTPYSYQWYNDTAAYADPALSTIQIAGQTSSTLSITAGNSLSEYAYFVKVTDNSGANATSNLALIVTHPLNVPKLNVTVFPTSLYVKYPDYATAYAIADGGIRPYSYQWYNDTAAYADPAFTATSIPGQTSAVFSIQAGNSNATYVYFVKVIDSANTVATSSLLHFESFTENSIITTVPTTIAPVTTTSSGGGVHGSGGTGVTTISSSVTSASAGVTVAQNGSSRLDIYGLYPNSELDLVVNGYGLGIRVNNVSSSTLGLFINNQSYLLKKGYSSIFPVSSSQQFNLTMTSFNGKNATLSLIAVPPSVQSSSLSQALSKIPIVGSIVQQASGLNAPAYAAGAAVVVIAVLYLLLRRLRIRRSRRMGSA